MGTAASRPSEPQLTPFFFVRLWFCSLPPSQTWNCKCKSPLEVHHQANSGIFLYFWHYLLMLIVHYFQALVGHARNARRNLSFSWRISLFGKYIYKYLVYIYTPKIYSSLLAFFRCSNPTARPFWKGKFRFFLFNPYLYNPSIFVMMAVVQIYTYHIVENHSRTIRTLLGAVWSESSDAIQIFEVSHLYWAQQLHIWQLCSLKNWCCWCWDSLLAKIQWSQGMWLTYNGV